MTIRVKGLSEKDAFSAAARSTTIIGTPAVRIATTTIPTTVTTTSVFEFVRLTYPAVAGNAASDELSRRGF
jgi:hypothetical protein